MVRLPTDRAPTHPGEMLREEFLAPLHLNDHDLADALHLPYEGVKALVQGDLSVTASIALRLARFFGTTPDLWLNLQIRWDLYQAKVQEAQDLQQIQPHRSLAG